MPSVNPRQLAGVASSQACRLAAYTLNAPFEAPRGSITPRAPGKCDTKKCFTGLCVVIATVAGAGGIHARAGVFGLHLSDAARKKVLSCCIAAFSKRQVLRRNVQERGGKEVESKCKKCARQAVHDCSGGGGGGRCRSQIEAVCREPPLSLTTESFLLYRNGT